ncbi:IS110 family transposase [Bowmanella yangjiangensis]|uniref:IS110 family transposase n=1 Tax=Bowmanella yangjiangensis TaxID=2811230 RepID=A0ABS3CVZ4_9ALTE|nr:IS110 family transposase [Bowmanella yangjiangensis]MBN7821293.1 IS110 family transposase [Bowmanella yangjiangensis]
MRQLNVLAIDLAKTKFQVCKRTPGGQIVYNKMVSRAKLTELLATEKPSLVAMESCGGTHHWARYAKAQGHQVKAMSARKVKAFLQGHKTDANDAEAIAIAATQPQVKACRLLSKDEQCQQSILRIRELLVHQKVASTKQLRDLLLELNYPIPVGDSALNQAVPEILEEAENGLSSDFRAVLSEQWQHIKVLWRRLEEVERRLTHQASTDVICQRLQQLEGVGPVNAMSLKTVLNASEHFKNSRQAAACIGVTPVQHSSGGKERMGAISRLPGHKKLRSTLYEGAMAVIRQLAKREARTVKEQWLQQLIARRGKKVAAIALANKTVRTAYAMLKNNTDYQPVMLAA